MRASLVALVALAWLAGWGAAEARDWSPRTIAERVLDGRPAIASSDVVATAERYLGQGNVTGTVGPWCADFASFVLRRVGLKPLANRMAASALAYGPIARRPRPGDLVVMRTKRGRAAHVGILVADLGDDIEIVSGNWGHRVALARVSRAAVTAFIRPRA